MIRTIIVLLFCALVVHSQNFQGSTTLARQRRNARDCVETFSDFYFLIDIPRALTRTNLQRVSSYMAGILEGLPLGEDQARATVISFGTSVTHHFTHNDTQTDENAVQSLNSLRLQTVGTKVRPVEAMDYLIANVLTPENDYRDLNNSVCVLIFGTRFRFNSTAAGLRLQQYCRVIAVGLGNAALLSNRINRVTSGPGQTIVNSRYSVLNSRVDLTLRYICRRPLRSPQLAVARTTRTTGTVQWNRQAFAVSYRATIQQDGSSRILQRFNNVPATRNGVTFTNLREATSYIVFVVARNEEGNESPRGSVRLVTSLAVPVPRLVEDSITTTSVEIVWENVGRSRGVSYFVTVSEEGGTRNDTFTIPVLGTRVTLNGLKPGTEYNVTAQTALDRLRSEDSDPVVFTTVPPPPQLRLSRVRLVEMIVVWDEVPGAVAYDIVMRDLQTQQERRFFDLTERTLLIENLIPSRRYELTATAIGVEDRRSSVSESLVAVTAPSNPEDITSTDVTTNSISFRWSAQRATVAYIVIITSSDHRGYRVETRTTALSFTATRMLPGAFYRIVVLSVSSSGVTDSNVVFPLFAQTVPLAPRNLEVVRVTSNSIEITWARAPGARVFHVTTEKLDGETSTGVITRSTNTSSASAVVSNLEPGTMYEFRVAIEAVQTGMSDFSDPIQDSTYAATPNVPRSTAVTSSHITIEIDQSEGARSYVLNVQSVDANGNSLVGGDRLDREYGVADISEPFVIPTLIPGLRYSITVSSVSVFGKVNPVSSPALIEQTAPLAPFAGSFENIESTSLVYTWRAVEGALSYIVIVSSDDFDNEFTEEFREEYETEETSFLVENLRPGTVYRFNLQSVGLRDRRSRISTTSISQTVPDNPTNVRQGRVTESTAVIEWDPTKGATSYRIRVESNETNDEPTIFFTRETEMTVDSLRGGTWYTFTIFARNQRRQEGPTGSDPLHVQTVLSPPNGVEVSQPTVNSFVVSWNHRPGALGYRVRAFTRDSNVDTKTKSVRVNGATEALIDELDPGTEYRFFVASIGFQGQISPESDFVSDVTLPTAPDQPLTDRVSSTTITISWNRVKGAVRYTVTVVQDIPNNDTDRVFRTNDNELRVQNLLPGGWYNFTVRSIGRGNRRNPQDSPLLRVQTIPLAPITIDFDSFTSTSVRLEWNAVIGAGGYAVTATEEDADAPATEQETEDTHIVLTGLLPGTAYTFEVATIGEDEDRRSRTTVSASEETIPDTPDTPRAFDVTDEQIRFRWNNVKGARRYVVMVTSPATGENQTLEVSTNSALLHDLQSGTLYMCRVFSVGIRRRRNPIPSGVLTVFTAPSPPSGIRTTNVETTSLALNWDEVQGALSYEVDVTRIQSSNEDVEERNLAPTANTQIVINGLEPGREYQFSIRAIGNENRESGAHPEFRDATLPEVPQTPAVARVFTTSIRYTWNRTPGALRYRIFITQEGRLTQERASVNPSYVLSNLNPGTRYSFSVQAIGARNRVSSRPSDIVTQQTITEPPNNFRVTRTSHDTIALTWDEAIGAGSYFLAVETNGDTVREVNVEATNTVIGGLISGTDYDFELRSVGDANVRSTDFSDLEEVTLPEAPTQVNTVDVDATEIELDWQDVRGAVEYDVRVDGVSTVTVRRSDVTLRSLESGVFYNVEIFSIGVRNRLSERSSDIIRIQTNPSPPVCRVTDVTTTTIEMSWVVVEGASSYTFQIIALTPGIPQNLIELNTEDNTLVITGLESGVEYSITGFSLGIQAGRRSVSQEVTESTLPSRPDRLQIDLVTSTSIQVSWQRQRGALEYVVEVDGVEVLTTADSVYMGRELDQGTFYDVVVYAVGDKERRNPVGSDILRVQTASGAAANFVVTEETTNSIALEWDDVVGRSQFEIVVDTVRNSDELDLPDSFKMNLPLTFRTQETSIEISDLLPGVEYLFRLKAFGLQGQLSNEESRVIEITLPTVPQGVMEVDATTTTVTIAWDASDGAEMYEISMKNDADDTTTSYTTGETSFTVTNLVPGGFFDFIVYAIGTRSKRNPQGSDTISLQTIPLPPQNYRVAEASTTEINLEWEDVLGRLRFELLVTNLDDDTIEPMSFSTQDTTFTVPSLPSGTAFQINIQTIGMQSQKDSEVITVRHSTVTATVDQPTIVGVTTTTIDVEWNAVMGAIQYHIRITRIDADAPEDNTAQFDSTEPRFEAQNLVPGARYQFVVFSVGVGNVRTFEGSIPITQQTVTLPPTGAVTQGITVSSFTLRWDAAFGASSYIVEIYETLPAGDVDLINTIVESSTTTAVTSLRPGTGYIIILKSVGDNDVESTSTTETDVITLPATIELPSVVEVTTDTIVLEWNSVRGAERYLVETTRVDPAVSRDVAVQVTSEMTSEPNYVATNLISGASYRVVIFSVGVNGRNPRGSPEILQQTVTLPPDQAEVYDVTVMSFSVRWDSAFGASSYNVYVYELNEANSDLVSSLAVDGTMTTLTSLKAGTAYRVEIRSVGEYEVESAGSRELELITIPDTLDRPTVIDVTTTSISLQWNAVAGAIRYIVETTRIDELADEIDLKTDTVEELRYTAENLVPGATYQFVLFSVGTGDVINENGSPPVTKQTVPLPPPVVTAENATERNFQVYWSEVYGAASYNIYVYEVTNNVEELHARESVLSPPYTVESLNAGTEYRTRIRAVGDEDQESADSIRAVTATQPGAVSLIVTYNVQTDSVDIEWNEPEGAQRYLIVVQNLNENEETTIDSTAASLSVIGLMPGTHYEMRVISIGALSVTNINQSVSARAQTVPLPPDDVQISEVTTTSFRVSWSPSFGAASYSVFVTSTNLERTIDLSTTDTSLTVVGLASGTQYFVSVLSTGQENQQSDLTEAVEDRTIPSTVEQLDFSNRSTTTVTLLWEEVTGAVSYEIVYRERDADPSRAEMIGTEISEIQIVDLEPGRWYEFSIFSIGTQQRRNEEGSEALEVQTVPLPPSMISVRNILPTSVVVSWNAATGAASYRLTYQTAVDGIPVTITTASTRQEIAGLLSGTAYVFVVTSIGQEGQRSVQSPERIRSTSRLANNLITKSNGVVAVPATPRNVQVEGIFATIAQLTWTAERGAVSYRVAVHNLATDTTVFVMSESPSTTIRNLFPGIWYEFAVFSLGVDELLNGQGSPPIRRQTIPRAPSQIVVTEADTNALSVSWQPVIGAAMYLVEVTSPDEDAFVPSSEVTEETAVTFVSLSSGTVYSFSVTAIGEERQRSEPGQAVSQTVLPGKPLGVRATTITTTSITLEWQSVKGAIRYRIVATNQETEEAQESESVETGSDVTSLLPGNQYEIVIFSISTDEKINPEGSDPLEQQTLTRPPVGVQLLDITTTSMTVAWQPVIGAQTYVITIRSDDTDANVPSEVITSQLSATVEAFSSGTIYSFNVRAINFEGRSSRPSTPAVGTTLPDNPNPLSFDDIQTTTITLSWPQIKGAIRYRIRLVNTETNEVRTLTRTTLRLELDELEPGTWYEATVFSIGRDSGNEEGSDVVRVQTVPLPPANVAALVQGEVYTTVVVTWDRSKGATQYRVIARSEDTDVNIPSPIMTRERSVTFENLSNGTRYSFIVVALGAQGGESEESQPDLRVIAPATVNQLEVEDISENSIALAWQLVKGAVSYRVVVTNVETESVRELRTPSTSITVQSLEAGTFYTLQIFSIGEEQTNAVGSDVIRRQTVPESPLDVAVLQDRITTSSLSLSWQSVKGAASYDVIFASSGEATENNLASSQTEATVAELLPGVTYRFQVVAVGEEGQRSQRSGEIISATKPESISEFTVTEITNSTVSLEWARAPGARIYRVFARNVVTNTTTRLDTTELFTTIYDLTSGTHYDVNVISVGSLTLENSNSAALRTVQTAPNPPRSLEATEVGTTFINLVWGAARGATSYLVEVTWTVSGEEFNRTVTSESTSLLVDELLPGTLYRFNIQSRVETGLVSSESRVVEETTRPDTATNLVVEEVTTTTATLRWGRVRGAQRYVVQYRERNANTDHLEIESSTTGITIDDLQAGVWYEFMVFSIGARGRRNEEGSDILHLQTVPLPPSGVTISDVTTTQFVVNWNNVVGVESFIVRVVRKEDVENPEIQLESDGLRLTVQNLASGTEYDVFVTSVGEENQRSEESDVASVTTIPETPENLRLVGKTTTTAEITWSAVKGAVRYEVTVVDLATSQTQTHSAFENGIELSDLVPGKRYSATIRSVGVNGQLNEVRSEPLEFQTVPLPPANIRTQSVSTNEIQLQWDEALGVHTYVIRVATADADDLTLRVAVTSATVGSLEPGTSYQFYVTSLGDEDQRSAESVLFQETTIPSTPGNVLVTNRDTTSATVTWDPVKGAVSFTLDISSNNTDYDVTVQSAVNSYVMENLVPGGWYVVTVTSFGANNRNNPTPSDELVFQTAPLPPSNIEVTQVATDRISLSWDAVLGAQSYSIEYVGQVRRTASTSNDEFDLHNLLPGTEYTITVTTVAQQEGLMSSPSDRAVEITTIDAPERIRHRDETTTSVVLSWDSVDGTARYLVRSTSIDGDSRYESVDNEVTIDDLSPGTRYTFTVATLDAKERESVTRSDAVNVVTVTSAPANVQVHDLQSRSFVLAWDAPRGAERYEILLLHENRALTDELVEATSFTFSGLSPGILYEVSVAALNENERRSEVTLLRQRTVPLPPSGLQVFDIQPDSFNVSWGAVTGARFYDVFVTEQNVLSSAPRIQRVEDTVARVTSLDSGTFYRIAISSVTEELIRSARNATTRQQTLTSAPVNLQGTPVNESAISLNWDDVTGATYYTVYYYDFESRARKTVVEAEQVLEQITSSEIVIGGLQPRVNYTFAVSASIQEGLEGERSEPISLETYALSPVLPETDEPLIRVSNITKTSFVLEWDPILNAVSYVIVVRASSIITDEELVRGGNTTRLALTNQLPDTDYSVALKAVGLIGDMTNESRPAAEFTTLPLAPPRPFGVRVTQIRATYFEIAWEVMPRALSYDVDIYDEATGNNRTISNIRGTSANITDLVVLNYYLFTVTSIGRFERSPPSSPVRVQARHPVPVMPRGNGLQLITVSDITFSSLVVTVAPIEHAESYIIIVRRNGATQNRINDVSARTGVDVENLDQNTLYEITYQAVGRGGERSEESTVLRTRTRRLVPDIPNNFQIVSVGPEQVIVRWSAARFAVSYRLNVQNTRTGVLRIIHNATSPFVIRDLEFRETYNVSVASIGKFFDSDFVQPISIDIPYPTANNVTGVIFDQISTTSFRLRWNPTPFAIGYTVVVAEIGGRTRRIQFIRRIHYRVRDLRPGTRYNVTVESISHNGISVSSGNYLTVTTNRGSFPTRVPGETTTVEQDLLSGIIQALVTLLTNIPDSLIEVGNSSDPFPTEETQEEIQYLEILQERLQLLRTEVSETLTRDIRTSRIIPRFALRQPQFDFGAQTSFQRLLSLGGELKVLVMMNDTSSESTADSIANRLTIVLTELVTTDSTLSGDDARREIRELLFPYVQHELEDVRSFGEGGHGGTDYENENEPFSTDEPLTIFVRPQTLSSSGFTVNWGRHGNIHRYKITVNEVLPGGDTVTIIDGVTLRQFHTLTNLKPSTNYAIEVRPVNNLDEVIPGVSGRTRATTLEEADSNFNVITNVGFNDVTLTWDEFPSRVINMVFRIRLQGDLVNHQQFSVNRAHRSIRFTSLVPGTTYEITATANSQTFLDTEVTTRSGIPIPNSGTTALPVFDTLVPPTGINIVSVMRSAITIEWLPARIRNVAQSFIRYNVRLYAANTQRLRSFQRFVGDTQWTFRGTLNSAFYDATVSTYNILTRRESRESPRLRIDTRAARRRR